MINIKSFLVFSVLVLIGIGGRLYGNDHQWIKQYVFDDVVAVVYLDTTEIKPTAIVEQLEQFGLTGGSADRTKNAAKQLKVELGKLTNAGVRSVYAVLRTDDISAGQTTWFFQIEPGQNIEGSERAIRKFLQMTPLAQFPLEFRKLKDAVVVSDSQARCLAAIQGNASDADLDEAWSALGDGHAGLIVFGDMDSRKVVKALFPSLPQPFESLSGKLIADQLRWGGLRLEFPPELKIKIEIDAEDESTAKSVAAAIESGIQFIARSSQFQEMVPQAERDSLLAAMMPITDGSRTIVDLDSLTSDLDSLAKIVSQPIRDIRKAAQSTQEMNNLRQLALAFHNYESAFKIFPRTDGKSEQTPAGLSWRVHILPFLNEGELYREFKLDEPWNSEHNKKLISRMPEVYRSPLPWNADVNVEGKTIYQVPVSDKALFQPNKEGSFSFRDITDGSSNTIMIVAVSSESASIWTKPDDWEFDESQPWQGLKDDDRNKVMMALADGSTLRMSNKVKPSVIKALVTRAGGEIVAQPFPEDD